MNYLTRIFRAFWGWPDSTKTQTSTAAAAADNVASSVKNEHALTPVNIERNVADIWQLLHSNTWRSNDPDKGEIISKLQNIFSDESFPGHFSKGKDGGGVDAETFQKIVDILLLLAMTTGDCEQDVFYQLDLFRNFQQMTNHDITDVLSRSVILKSETGKAFFIPTRDQFVQTSNCYVKMIDKLDGDDGAWKKRVYFIQFLNYLANNREVHLWPNPSLHQAVMERIDDWEKIEEKRLDWHREILTPNKL